MLPQSDLLMWHGLLEGLAFSAKAAVTEDRARIFSLPFASSNKTVSSIANVEF